MARHGSGGHGRGGSWFTACFFPSSSGAECGEDMSGEESMCVFMVAADYQRQENTEISLHAGERVEVIEKNDTGWWFVSTAEEQGWVPSTYLVSLTEVQNEHRAPKRDSRYVTVQSYSSSGPDELGFECGVTVDVIQKNLEGWWFIRCDGKEGWAPASYLRKLRDDVTPSNHAVPTETGQESMGQVEIIGNLMEISNLLTRKTASDTHTSTAYTHTQEPPTHTEDFSSAAHTLSDPQTDLRSDTHRHTSDNSPDMAECVSVTDTRVCVSVSEPRVCSVQRTHTPAIARVTPQRYHSVENGSPSSREKPAPRRENSLGFQLPQLPDPPSVDVEYYTIAEFHSCLSDGISFSGGERAEVIKKNSGGWWFVHIGEKEGWAPCSYIDKRKKPSLNRKTSTLTRPKVPPPAPPIKKQSSLPCIGSEVSTFERSRLYEEPEYDVPTVGLESELEFLPADSKSPHSAPYWLGEEVHDQNAEEQSGYDGGIIVRIPESQEMRPAHSHTYSSSRGHQRPVWDPPEYDAPTVELSTVSISEEQLGEGSKPKPSVRPKPANPDFSSLGRSLKPTNQLNQNNWRTSRTSGGSETDSASSLDDSTAFKLSVSAEAEDTHPWLSISTEGELLPPQLSVSMEAKAMPIRAPLNNVAEAMPLQLYRSTAEFQQGAPGELSLPAGVLVEVLEKQQSGWWFVRWGALEGWVPTYFLGPITNIMDSDKGKNEQREQTVIRSDQNHKGVSGLSQGTVRVQDYASITKNCASVANDYASITKDKNGAAKENASPCWKESPPPQITRRDLTSSGRSIPVSMVKPKPHLIHNNLREEYISLADYHGNTESMGFPVGTRLEVLKKNINGWWYCRTLDSTHTRQGWVPSNFLEKRK